MTDDSNRIDALDFLRGFAVMGMALANIVAIGLPAAAQSDPFAVGTKSPLGLAAWTFNFLLVDGKFRALFAMMLGASILLVMEAAELDGRDGFAVHRKRMIWLAIFGVADHVLLWSGDLLLPLALAGLIGTALAGRDTFALVKWALGLLALQWAIDLVALFLPFARPLLDGTGAPAETTLFHSGYGTILIAHVTNLGRDLIHMALFILPETLAFLALGMAMLKGGFLAAQWTPEQYRGTWRRAYLVGLLPMAALAAWALIGHNSIAAGRIDFGWTVPLRLPLAAAHAALALAIAIRFPDSALVGAVRAVGRLALSNYLLFGLAATVLFYGYGAGLFGRLDRAALMVVGVAGCALMLLCSMLWRRWIGQGPAEWLWRRLVRGGSVSPTF